MQRFHTLKSEIDRLADLNRCFGKAFGADLLDDRDRLGQAHPRLGPFLSDIVLAAAADKFNLDSETLASASEDLLLQILAWAHIELPQESPLPLGEFLEPALLAMAATPMRDSTFPGLDHSVLMQALYRFDPRAAPALGTGSPEDLLRWYYLEGVVRHRLHRCIGAREIAALNHPREVNGLAMLSLLDIWALQLDPNSMEKFNFRTPSGQIQAREAAWSIREADPVLDFYYLPFRPRQAREAKPRATLAAAGLDPLLADTYRIGLGTARYLGAGRSGNALLLAEEWGIEQGFAWALAPVSTLVFTLGDTANATPRAFGFSIAPFAAAETLGQTLTVFLNGVDVLSLPVGAWLTQDAVVIHDPPFIPGLNLLQFAVDKPLIPAVQFGSHDTRALGIALRRVWVA